MMFENAAWFHKLPDASLEVYEPHVKLFFQTMFERQEIWFKRFVLEESRPWTNDPIFNSSKFTNVYRELDKNSQWQIKNILLDDENGLIDMVWKMMLFRFFNEPRTFEMATDEQLGMFCVAHGWRNGIPSYREYDEDTWADHIEGVRNSGQNPYTSAYLINSQACPGQKRDWCYTRKVIPTLHRELPNIIKKIKTAKSPEEFIKYLNTFPAVADFIAHEFYQDFTYLARYTSHLQEFFPWTQDDYTNVGPGASIGIRLIFPNLATVKEQKQAIYWLRDLAEEQLKEIGDFKFLYWDIPDGHYYVSDECNITLHQIEMWLCEFQKYWKMQIGLGKQRSQFCPTSTSTITK